MSKAKHTARITVRLPARLKRTLLKLQRQLEVSGRPLTLSAVARSLLEWALGWGGLTIEESELPLPARACSRRLSVSVRQADAWVVERVQEEVAVLRRTGIDTSFSRELIAAAKRGLER